VKNVTVIDYGIGNLLSVTRALEHCGVTVTLARASADVERAEKIILPGVGAFEDGMRGLRERGLDEPLRKHAASGKPLLGICLGMQMLMERSEEFGDHEGLGIIPGEVKAIPGTTADGSAHKIPHIGWNALVPPGAATGFSHPILDGVALREAVYFVHSFTPVPSDDTFRVADAFYNGRRISAVIAKGSVVGCQFHPEKSSMTGLRMIRNFLS
jgi:glutamine amidotransferase